MITRHIKSRCTDDCVSQTELIFLVISCRSIRNKIHKFSALVDLVKPSVILGTKFWFEPDIGDNEVFLDGYTCYRKDINAHGDGVFIFVENSIHSSEVYVGTGDCEAIFCQLIVSNNKVLTACSFYRPPDSPVDAMTQLIAMPEAVRTNSVVIKGDFNLPNIVCSELGRAIATAG